MNNGWGGGTGLGAVVTVAGGRLRRLGRRRGVGGWASPYYGNWYRGGWGNSAAFWTGFRHRCTTSFGLGSMYGGGYGGWSGYGYPGYGSRGTDGIQLFPDVGHEHATADGDWARLQALGSIAATRIPTTRRSWQREPAQTTVVYDYSRPINVAAAPPDASVTESTEQVFSAAATRSWRATTSGALDLSDQVLKATPDASVVHEFRATVSFALKRYDEAASVDYAVLTAGPGWNWSTMAGLYPGVDVYTDQLRALEAFARANPNSTSAHFLLGYHYMVQGHQEAAAGQFEAVVQLQPNETLSAQFVKALRRLPSPLRLRPQQPRRRRSQPAGALHKLPRSLRRLQIQRPAAPAAGQSEGQRRPSKPPNRPRSSAGPDGGHLEGAARTWRRDHADASTRRRLRLGS